MKIRGLKVKCTTDHTIMPFGRLVKESLESGLNTLFDIKDLVLALYEAKQALTNVLGKFALRYTVKPFVFIADSY